MSKKRPIEWVTNEKGCMLVTSHKRTKDGYIRICRHINKKETSDYLHRMEYRKHHGEIPKGMVIMHSCDEPSCINIEHLSLGTHKNNMYDMIHKGRAKGNFNTTFEIKSNRIKQLRIQKGLTGQKLSQLVGITESQINRIENQKSNGSLITLQKIANSLGVTMSELF